MAPEGKAFRAACVQMRAGLSRSGNTEAALALISEAAAAGARFVATPEMTNVVDRDADRLFQTLRAEDGLEEIAAFAGAAKKHKIWLLIGSMAVKVGERRAANRSFLFAPDGAIVARYDKIHMFDVRLADGETWKESTIYQPGECATLVETPLAKIGLTICYDLRFPNLYRLLSRSGAEVLCVPSAFTKQTGEAHWATLLRARAIENGAFVIAPAQGGRHEDGRDTYGHSMIIDPWGKVLAAADNAAPGVIIADIHPGAAYEARQRIPNLSLEQNLKVSIISL